MTEMTFKERLRGVSLIFACGTALFSDGYSNNIIGSGILKPFTAVNTLLTRIYGAKKLAAHNNSRVLTSLGFAGFVVGMLLFGYISDKIGRKFGMMTATGIVAVFSLLSAASSGTNHSVTGLLSMLSAMRFLLGIGLGAEYPCGSVSACEQSEGPLISKTAQHRWIVLATNTMIDFGFVIAALVPLVLFWILGNDHLRAVWRLSLGLGFVPAAFVFLWRLNMEEPMRYKTDSMKHAKIPYWLVIKRYGGRLAAISAVWFLFDFIAYPFGLYSSIIFDNLTGNTDSLGVIFGWNVVSNLFHMPGALFGAFVVDYLGAKNTMILGLLLQALTGFFMSGFYIHLTHHIALFAVIYGVFLSFGGFGPGNCTILLAGKSSPTAVRGQFYGVAAAAGKVGAFVGTWVFPPIIDAFGGSHSIRGNTGPFWIGSGCAILSALITFFFIPNITTDGMEKEDREFRAYLEAHGYDTTAMGIPGSSNEFESVEEPAQEKSSTEKV